jgi:hypothetical protein
MWAPGLRVNDTTTGEQSEFVASHKNRKPRGRTRDLWDALATILEPYDVISVRGAYYQAEMAGIVGKTDADYDRVQRALLAMRRAGILPYSKICDNARERRQILQHSGLRAALEHWHKSYRVNYWLDQPTHVEVWCEKDALTPIINPVCQQYGVTFCAIRGFDSESFIYTSAMDLRRVGKPARIHYLGDHDPSGWFIAENLESRLREFGAEATVLHMGVNPQQVSAMRLPTRPGKRADTRYRAFVERFGSDRCTEVDAIPPTTLRDMVARAIVDEIDVAAWRRLQRVEELERTSLENVIEMFGDAAPGTTYTVVPS